MRSECVRCYYGSYGDDNPEKRKHCSGCHYNLVSHFMRAFWARASSRGSTAGEGSGRLRVLSELNQEIGQRLAERRR